GRRQARQIEGDGWYNGLLRRVGGGLESSMLEPGQDETVNGVPRPGDVLDGRQVRTLWRDERPVVLPDGPLFDPLTQQRDLASGQLAAGFHPRHAFAAVGCGGPPPQMAFLPPSRGQAAVA